MKWHHVNDNYDYNDYNGSIILIVDESDAGYLKRQRGLSVSSDWLDWWNASQFHNISTENSASIDSSLNIQTHYRFCATKFR